jgi:hypothetical protein
MHAILARRGIASTTAALATGLASQAAMAAPTEVLPAVTAAALSGAAGSGGIAFVMFSLAMNKIKFGIVSAIIAAGMVTAFVGNAGKSGIDL